ncbi:MAG TPA: hypothetical protein VL172_18010 [Kofleriaceae bacterium]|nr:hypothetical protein [Kofleriaceae bacterium]
MARALVLILLATACSKNESSSPKQQPPDKPIEHPEPPPAYLGKFKDPPREAGPAHATQIALGSYHGCARMSDDTMRCWGDNGAHQLGVDPYKHPKGAVATPPVTDVVQVAAGQMFTCARKRDHTVWCWGYDLYGELGKGGDQSYSHDAAQIKGVTDAVDIDAGDRDVCVVNSDATVMCWGDNSMGQLGDGTTEKRAGPVRAKVTAVKQVSVGFGVCALRIDGTVACWGEQGPQITQPTGEPLKDVVRVAIGGGTGCAVRVTGELWCWGNNDTGQLGRPDPADTKPGPVPGFENANWAAPAGDHACAVGDTTVYCWGIQSAHPAFPKDCLRLTHHTGGAGAGGPSGGAVANWPYCPTPTAIPDVKDAIAVETMWHDGTCALTRDGSVYCWSDKVEKLAL